MEDRWLLIKNVDEGGRAESKRRNREGRVKVGRMYGRLEAKLSKLVGYKSLGE